MGEAGSSDAASCWIACSTAMKFMMILLLIQSLLDARHHFLPVLVKAASTQPGAKSRREDHRRYPCSSGSESLWAGQGSITLCSSEHAPQLQWRGASVLGQELCSSQEQQQKAL